MAVTINDVLELDIMKGFRVVAGESGLTETVNATEILDFEFLQEGTAYRKERIFEGESIVLSSLLFAKDQPELVLDAVRRLKALNVKALAYKPVFFQELPQNALDYADSQGFVILKFGYDEFFEDVIAGIKELVEKDQAADLTESLFEEMLERKFTPEEAEAAKDKINPLLRPEAMAVCLRLEGSGEERIRDIIRRGRVDQRLSSKIFVGKCKDKLMVILSQDNRDLNRFRALMEDVKVAYDLTGEVYVEGVSEIRNISDGLDRIILQAFWAQAVAEIEGERTKFYKDMGVYKLIISDIHSAGITEYMESYLEPLFEDSEKEQELLHTAIEYILVKGDSQKTADRLFCHKNTIRYRLSKLQEKLDPAVNEREFYQNLAMAIKIYLLLGKYETDCI
ncbi:MAG: PucR family transcriptional regulator [Firmicutes bacterium]|nr:PucR family transcriptional regulator [Bacillota bacterium]